MFLDLMQQDELSNFLEPEFIIKSKDSLKWIIHLMENKAVDTTSTPSATTSTNIQLTDNETNVINSQSNVKKKLYRRKKSSQNEL
jgi:hypothetical protein